MPFSTHGEDNLLPASHMSPCQLSEHGTDSLDGKCQIVDGDRSVSQSQLAPFVAKYKSSRASNAADEMLPEHDAETSFTISSSNSKSTTRGRRKQTFLAVMLDDDQSSSSFIQREGHIHKIGFSLNQPNFLSTGFSCIPMDLICSSAGRPVHLESWPLHTICLLLCVPNTVSFCCTQMVPLTHTHTSFLHHSKGLFPKPIQTKSTNECSLPPYVA
jgi:hypothetical protein